MSLTRSSSYPALDWSAAAPIAEKQTKLIDQHGYQRDDPYDWMRDDRWQEVMQDPSLLDEKIRAHLEAENSYLDAVTAPTKQLQTELFEELKGRIKEDDSGVPTKDGDWGYYSRYLSGAQHPQFVRQKWSDDIFDAKTDAQKDAEVQVLFDGDTEAQGAAFFRIGALEHSPDHKLLAVAVDRKGSEFCTLEIRSIETGEVVSGPIEKTSGNIAWSADSSALLYTTLEENFRPQKLFCHRIGEQPDNDMLMFEEQDEGFFVSISKSETGDFIFVNAHQHETDEVRLINAKTLDAVSEPVRPRQTGVQYRLAHQGRKFLVLTNVGGAIDFKIMTTRVESPQEENWVELIAHRRGKSIVDFQVFNRHLVRLERQKALPSIVIMDVETGVEHSITLDEEAYSLGLSGGYEYVTNSLRYSYTSPTTPASVFDYDMDARTSALRKTQEIPSGHDRDDYVTRRWFVTADDGAEVPATALYHKDTPLDGSAPVLLYGYGSYGMAMPASFSTGRLSLVDRGFIYVIAHIRGGAELGDAWYKAGRHKKKLNTFTDFIAVADDLIARGWTKPKRIACHGGSAGGLLVGAVINMRPDLFGVCVGQVPFVDVTTTISDATLPLTPIEWPEWGNPIESKADYELIASYSPIDNVVAADHPLVLATGGLTDPRVTYWEPAKWVATLREKSQNATGHLLKINMDAGHGGASGRFDNLKETALIYSVLLSVLG